MDNSQLKCEDLNSIQQKQQQEALHGKIFIIRHAQSTYNYAWILQKAKINRGPHPEEDVDLIDAMLTEEGQRQCENTQKFLPNLKVVLISPYRRAVQTAYLLFKNYSNFNQIKFIIEPNLREHLDSPCDVPISPLSENIKFYKKMIPQLDLSLFDALLNQTQKFSQIPDSIDKKELWVLCDQNEEEVVQPVLQILKQNPNGLKCSPIQPKNGLNISIRILQALKHLQINESETNKIYRVNKTLEVVRQIETDGQIALVGHSCMIYTMTNQALQNCELLNIDKLFDL